jgi:3-oxoacyl-[acyl-carrier protein] reductase
MIIVTGVAGGLGSDLIRHLAGFDEVLVGTYHQRRPQVSDHAQLIQVDVTDPDSTRQFSKTIEQDATRITLINLAGVSISKLAVDTSPDEWDRVVDTSLKGSFLMSQAVLRFMIREKWGRIINVSSVAAHSGVIGTAAYASAKAGVTGLSKVLAAEYGRYGILVNTLMLGYFDCGMASQLSEDHRKAVLARIPLKRFASAIELAEAVRYLMRSNYVTGAEIPIDGGYS